MVEIVDVYIDVSVDVPKLRIAMVPELSIAGLTKLSIAGVA